MRKVSYLLILILAVALFSTMGTALAQEPTAKSDYQIQNFSTSADANIIITYYNSADGSALPAVSDTIPAGGSKNYAPIPDAHGLPSDFAGSAVVSSDQPVAAVVNLIADNGFGGASYNSASSGATTVSFPLVFNGFFRTINSYFYIQNVASTVATINVNYVARIGTVDANAGCTLQATIQPGASVKFDQAGNPCLQEATAGQGFFGSATVTSDVNIAGALVQYDDNSIQANNGLTAADASTNPVAPLFISNIFYTWSSMNVQNTGSTTTTVEVTYTPSAAVGSQCTQSQEIGPQASFAFGNAYIQDTAACTGGTYNTDNNTASFIGSAAVTANSANQPLVALVNQVDLPGLEDASTATTGAVPPVRGANASAYAAFNPANGRETLSFPIIIKRLNFASFQAPLDTSISIFNVGNAAADVTCSFSGRVEAVETDVSQHNRTATIQPGASMNISQNHVDSTLPDVFVGNARCTAPGGSLVGTTNQLGNRGDLLTTYEGIGQ